MAVEPAWLTFDDVSQIHDDQLRRFGGLPGTRDGNLVHSAVAAPVNLFAYEHVDDPLVLAIHLGSALVRNHPFNDGNKRTAAVALIEFLAINGWDLVVPDDEPDAPLLGQWIEKLASGRLNMDQVYARLIHFIQERPE